MAETSLLIEMRARRTWFLNLLLPVVDLLARLFGAGVANRMLSVLPWLVVVEWRPKGGRWRRVPYDVPLLSREELAR